MEVIFLRDTAFFNLVNKFCQWTVKHSLNWKMEKHRRRRRPAMTSNIPHRFLTDVSARLREASGDPRAGSYFAQKISLAIQRGNAASILGTLPRGDSLEDIFYFYMDTMLHIFKGNIGSGLLAMGDAFKNGGLVFAPIMTLVLGVISVHAQHLLLNCSDEMYKETKRERPPGFADTVGLVFAHGPIRLRRMAATMRMLVITFLCVTQLGFCCVYIVFIANNVKMICDQYGINIDLSIHMIFVVIPVLLSCMVRNLKYLTPFSTIANVLMAVGVSVVVYEAAQDLPSVETRDYIATWQQLPLYFGTAIYAFEGIGLVLPLKNEMRRPELFQKPLGVLNVGMVIVGSIFIAVGFLGYLKWGDDVAGSLTLNLRPGHVLSNVVQAVIALAMLLTYPLQFYVPVKITWPALQKRIGTASPVAKELGYRALLVLLTFILAESIPQLGLFISLVGAVSSTALALVFPPLIELVMASQKPTGITLFMFVKDAIIIALGLFIFVTGTYESVASIIKAFRE